MKRGSSDFPDVETLRTVLTLATQAPSVHNSQPWHWRVDGRSVHLYADPSRHLPITDPDRRDLLISCGATLHHCTVALAATGWRADVHRFPDPNRPDHLAAVSVESQSPGELEVMLAAAIPRRRTDRRIYSPWPVPWGDIALMGARAARSGVMLRQIESIPQLSAIVADSVSRHSADPDYWSELNAWTGRHGSVSGVPARNTPDVVPNATVPNRVFAGTALTHTAQIAPEDDNGVVVALGTESDDCLSRLRAGEATSLVLLSATAMGLATCPVSEPLEVEETRDAVRADVFGADGYPQMLVKVGWAPVSADALPATPRRPLDDVTDWLPGPRSGSV